jgi:hypothetical protein
MYIQKLRIKNYKGFDDSREMEFGPGFNVIVGQNNSGKSALLECFRPHGTENKPHKTVKIPKGHLPKPHSAIEFDLVLKKEEFVDTLQRSQKSPSTPTPGKDGQSQCQKIFRSEYVTFRMQCNSGHSEFFKQNQSCIFPEFILENCNVKISVGLDQSEITVSEIGGFNADDDLPSAIYAGAADLFYAFKAERLTPGTYKISDESVLLPNAANLAAVLAKLFNKSPRKTADFNAHVTTIFPSIKLIQAPNVGGQYRIKIWTTEPDDDRDDLPNFLEDSGTGVGQVLAILYVAMTMPPSVIAIDEPNSFLHPGATKKLLQILKQYPHQYIISTHSTDIISTVEPDTLHLVQWQDGESKVKALNAAQVQDMRIVLNDVGVALSDVFAADQVIWVEGQTEQECFPKIARHGGAKIPLGLSFLAVHNTGDFEAKDWTARKIWELYKQLSNANGILPVATAFSLDRETRTQPEMDDLARQTEGKMYFLPRRAYENYLLHPDAIATILGRYLGADKKISAAEVQSWIDEKGKTFHPTKLSPSQANAEQWIKECDAAKLLSALFAEMSDATVEYKKTKHSVELTEWLLANAEDELRELIDYVVGLVPE